MNQMAIDKEPTQNIQMQGFQQKKQKQIHPIE